MCPSRCHWRAALLQQPQAGDILEQADSAAHSTFVCEVQSQRPLTEHGLKRLDPHQAPGAAADVGAICVHAGDSGYGAGRIMGSDRDYGGGQPDSRFGRDARQHIAKHGSRQYHRGQ